MVSLNFMLTVQEMRCQLWLRGILMLVLEWHIR